MASFNKYTGPWTHYQAAHLIRRSSFGANLSIIKSLGNGSLDTAMDTIFKELPMPDPPINLNFDADPNAAIGETWVDKLTSAGVNGYRRQSLRAWSMELLTKDQPNIREKMTLFWHNHFVVADISDPRFDYKYITLLRSAALGNFKQLTKDIVVDVAMLNYLNGRENTRQAPNENFARELMELFTLGKGTQVAPGDYSTFTEQDVMELARALTGWIDVRNNLPLRSTYVANRHDTTPKTLSHRFNNAVINNADEQEYKNVVDLIFEKEEVAAFIARKLYVWFVHSKIDSDIEQNIIKPMAQMIRDSGYEIGPAVKALLSSEHFYDECIIGTIIKNPIEFLVQPMNGFEMKSSEDAVVNRTVFNGQWNTSNVMQMGMFQAPSVAGWQAFYQEPNYYKLWLNATSLPARMLFTNAIAGTGLRYGTFRFKIDYPDLFMHIDDPSDENILLEALSLLMFSKPLAANQLEALKSGLNGANVATSWSVLYTAYKDQPDNEAAFNAMNLRIRNVVTYMMRMPEYHLN